MAVPGFMKDMLRKKYDIEQQEADAKTKALDAEASLRKAQAMTENEVARAQADKDRASAEALRAGIAPSGEDALKLLRGLKKGIARVPGKGSGKVDKVPAMLAPGEAVLNKAAAEKMGRGMIAKMNKAGARKMGMA